jgi:hypothetical protein
LFFDYLRADYPSALSALAALEARTDSPDRRLRLLSVRAQIFLGQKHFEQARATIAYLQSSRGGTRRRVEVTPLSIVLTAEPDPSRGWANYLDTVRAQFEAAADHPDEATQPPGHHNPDAPRPDADHPAQALPFAGVPNGDLLDPILLDLIRGDDLKEIPNDGRRIPRRAVPLLPRFPRPAPPPHR